MVLKENRGNVLVNCIIIVLILLVIVFGLGFIYLYKNSKKIAIKPQVELNDIHGEDLTSNKNSKEIAIKPQVELNDIYEEELTSDKKFQNYIRNLYEEVSNLEEGTTIGAEYSLPIENSFYYLKLDSNHNLSIYFSDKELENTYGTANLATNVIAYYNVFVGQDAFRKLYILKSDGTLWSTTIESVCFEKNYKISFKQDTEYKNIISVQGIFGIDAMYPLFIDIEGKTYY